MKVFLATPAYNGEVSGSYASSLMLACADCARRDIEVMPNIVANGAFIEIARTLLVQRFLETDCTHLFFVDADLGFDAHAFAGLVQAGVPFAAGVYRKRMAEVAFMCHVSQPEEMRGPWLRMDRVATGFMCLERRVLEEMSKRARIQPFIGAYENVPMVFHTVYGERFIGEDYAFCDDYNALYEEGVFDQPIWVYPDITFRHDDFLGNLHESLSTELDEPRILHRGET